MKKLAVLLVPLILIGGYLLLNRPTDAPSRQEETVPAATTAPENINYKATFSIITNGTTRIFTDPKYHNQSEDLFIEASNPNTVMVKKNGVTWNDFFKTLPMEITKECLTTGTGQIFCSDETKTLRFFVNDNEDKDALDKEIQNGDSLRVEYGI